MMRPPRPITLPFGQWRPDMPNYASDGLERAENCIPHHKGHKSFPSLSVVSDALSATPLGAMSAQDDSGTSRVIAGDASSLYRLSAASWSDVSKSGGYSVSDAHWWEMAKWNNKVIATNIADAVQIADLDTGSFADMITSTLKPKARHLGIVRQRHVVLGNLDEGGTKYPYRVRWSGIDDETTFDQDQTTQSDFQDLRDDAGWVNAIVGGEYGLIFQERGITRMTYVGTPEIFQMDYVERQRGAWAPRSVVPLGQGAFFLSDEGFFYFTGAEAIPIGDGKVDQYFLDNLNFTYRHRVIGSLFPGDHAVVWTFPTSAQVGGNPDKMLVFHWPTQEWSLVDLDMAHVFSALSVGYTLDDLDSIDTSLDSLQFSLDSAVWSGGNKLLSGFDATNKFGVFNGSALTALFETKEKRFNSGKSTINAARPLVEGTSQTTTVEVGSRNRQQDSRSYSTARAVGNEGWSSHRGDNATAQFHSFRINVSGGFDNAQGVEVEAVQRGRQ